MDVKTIATYSKCRSCIAQVVPPAKKKTISSYLNIVYPNCHSNQISGAMPKNRAVNVI